MVELTKNELFFRKRRLQNFFDKSPSFGSRITLYEFHLGPKLLLDGALK
jgi:hypothetical protein